jgi:UDP-N-acetylglucosamine--N-acetylmuramyl-(pentapeptide) pyrophosphoryl-undecaprenol N-acetylglucosamine transferase
MFYGNIFFKLRSLIKLTIGCGQAYKLLRSLAPAIVVGFGGYSSAPTVYAAARLGIQVLLHEQNAVIGRANRWLARRVQVIATGFPTVTGLRPADYSKTIETGNPVRPEIAALRAQPWLPPSAKSNESLELLVLGGSQGAQVFSHLIPAALSYLPSSMRSRLVINQQCRSEDLAMVRVAYKNIGVNCELSDFFHDIAARLGRAHLVISRAGASTIAELAAAGRPAILVPYPHAMDNHQAINASALATAGGAWVAAQDKLTPESLSQLLLNRFSQPETLLRAAAAARAFGRTNAATCLADAVLSLISNKISSGRKGHCNYSRMAVPAQWGTTK